MPPVPPPLESGFTARTEVPLYWCRYAPPSPRGRLLVLHGGPGAHHDYLLPQLLALAEEYECCFYDQRGGGKSRSDDRTPVTWKVAVRDLAAVASELVPGPLTIVGYSWGALLALLYGAPAALLGIVAGMLLGDAMQHQHLVLFPLGVAALLFAGFQLGVAPTWNRRAARLRPLHERRTEWQRSVVK